MRSIKSELLKQINQLDFVRSVNSFQELQLRLTRRTTILSNRMEKKTWTEAEVFWNSLHNSVVHSKCTFCLYKIFSFGSWFSPWDVGRGLINSVIKVEKKRKEDMNYVM